MFRGTLDRDAMTRSSPSMFRPCCSVLAVALLSAACLAQDPEAPRSLPGGPPPGSPPALPEGMTVQQMWPTPSAEDWKRPVLITFQRSWEDAVAVSQQTGKPIMICVNMDGEIASEHYAGIHYRSPETAKLFEDYVCVIASVYRHSPRDHDEHGHRIPCPRFGSVTCGEHIAIEPLLYERYMDGVRVSPRHIMVELDGDESFDVFYAWDNASIFTTIAEGTTGRAMPEPVVRGDRTIVERVAGRDIADRRAVEQAYLDGDHEQRARLLEAADEHIDQAPIELLRLAVLGLDAKLAAQARQALAKVETPAAVDVISDALSVPIDASEREPLLGALERLAAASPQARIAATVHRGLDMQSANVDVSGWTTARRGGATYAAPDRGVVEQRIDASEAAAAAHPDDAEAQLALAQSTLTFALDPESRRAAGTARRSGADFTRLMVQDAQRAALRAEQQGASDWRVDAVLAISARYLGDLETAHRRAIAAAAAMPPDPQDWQAIATLELFAQARQTAIWDALRAKTDWPREWMTDVNSVYSVLAHPPLGNAQHALTHYDFLDSLGAKRRAARVLDDGLRRFPDSFPLHDRLRARILAEQGVAGLEPAYEAMLAAPDAGAALQSHAGYSSIVAAEFYRRGGDPAAAVAAYERALAHFERAKEPAAKPGPDDDHFAALALAGLARIAVERGELELALERILASFARRPQSAAHVDGLEITPVMTAERLRASFEAAGDEQGVARVVAALAELEALDPRLLAPPEYERPVQRPRRGR